MRIQYVMWLGLIFACGTIISLTFGGQWLGTTELGITNTLTVFKDVTVLGIWHISVPNVDFFFTGMKSLMTMDFGFFSNGAGSGYQLIQWVIEMVIVLGASWGLFSAIIGVVASRFGKP